MRDMLNQIEISVYGLSQRDEEYKEFISATKKILKIIDLDLKQLK